MWAVWTARVTLKCSQQKCSGIITPRFGNIRRRLMAVISCSNLCSNIKKTYLCTPLEMGMTCSDVFMQNVY